MSLASDVVDAKDLRPEDVAAMQALMAAHYENADAERFMGDLAAKDRVILLRDGVTLCGFSTQVLFHHTFRGQTVRIVFSGDTIVAPSHWGSLALPVAWGRMMLDLLRDGPGEALYWLLTTKGFRTYRFLPVFFHAFVPRRDGDDPGLRALRDSVAAARFGARYDPARGVLAAPAGAQRLRPGLGRIDASRRRDAHVAFFERANPHHARGDELVCLCRFEEPNLTDFILRRLRP